MNKDQVMPSHLIFISSLLPSNRLAIAAYCQPLLSHDHLNLATDL